MKTQHNVYWNKAIFLTILALGLIMAWGQSGHPVLAQSPEAEQGNPSTPTPPSDEELEAGVVENEDYVGEDDVIDAEGGVIDIFDLAFAASRYGTNDSAADINFDGQVDIFDISLLAGSYRQAEAVAAAAIVAPAPLPLVEAGAEDFGTFNLSVEEESFKVEAQSHAVVRRPLKIGVGINHVKVLDVMDAQTQTPPDLYALAAASGVWARTATWWDSYEIWPNWRLGWWSYSSFPWVPRTDPTANNYSLPVDVVIRDDDGRTCYGPYGCRDRYEVADLSSKLQRRTKLLTLFPATCTVVDEVGVRTYGYWLDSSYNRCRVELQAWGTERPRAYVRYFIDAFWE